MRFYPEYEAVVDNSNLGSHRRQLTPPSNGSYAQEHRAELMEDWDLCNRNQSPKKIQPLA
jgi:hypothetical protein